MGSSGMKRSRTGRRREHLPKVGRRDNTRKVQQLERDAIADTGGFGATAPWVRWTALVICTLIVVGGVVALIAID